MIIAIDFDGTIVEHKFPYIGRLKPNAVETITRLYHEGHKIIIWTCRTSQRNGNFPKDAKPTIFDVKEFLDENNIPYHTINNNIPEIAFQPSPKVYADIYIDDKQLGGIPNDWEDIYNLINPPF